METSSDQNSFQLRATALGQTRSLQEEGSSQAANTEDVGHVVARVKHELQFLLLERAAIVKRIGVIRHTIAGLADVFGAGIADEELRELLSKESARRRPCSNPGLTDLCRLTLMESSQPLTTHQLCGRMQEKSPSIFARHKQPTNSVTVVLRRLVSYGEVQDGVNERDRRTWLWIGPRRHDGVVADLPP